MQEREIITEISRYYPLQIMKAYNNNSKSIKALEYIGKGLNDIFRYFEPAHFSASFYMCCHFSDTFCLPQSEATEIFDKTFLLTRMQGDIAIQVMSDGRYFYWETFDNTLIKNNAEILTYYFHDNRDYFLANGTELDVTIYPQGSRYAAQFTDLYKALKAFSTERVLYSSCPTFTKSWHDPQRLFFKSEGSGRNAPEKHMQESLYEFLRVQESLRGISIEVVREFNVNSDQPKPVDIRIQWKEANRTALIEVKWLGAVKSTVAAGVRREESVRGANAGYTQLKGYYDEARADLPTAIIKCHLVVIDGRRRNLSDDATRISTADGMYYHQRNDLEIDNDKRYYESVPGFEKPIKMFAAPVCS